MCLQHSAVRPYQKWHWAGDELIAEPIIPSSRKVPHTKITRYNIDIRSFLALENDAVVLNFLQKHIDRLPVEHQLKFMSDEAGSFDFRAAAVKRSMQSLWYKRSRRVFDSWLFPEETLAQGGGDCEDLSFLLAALLQSSGISEYCIRVALGSLEGSTADGKRLKFNHAWVMYQNERGAWEILDPTSIVKSKPVKKAVAGKQVEYIPHFVFNRSHLWRIRSSFKAAGKRFLRYVSDRSFWDEFNPSFAAGIHNDIFDEALKDMSWSDLWQVKAESFAIDVNTLQYDPRDHSDFASLDETWERIGERLKPSASLADFGCAGHAIADFYAHSLYGNFADRNDDGSLKLYNPAKGVPASRLVYNFDRLAPIPGNPFNAPKEAADHWKGRLISGQWWRWYTTFPSDLKKQEDFSTRRSLPDHDAVAVDSPTKPGHHKFYEKEAEYEQQFNLRKAAAIEHIKQAYGTWKKNNP
ncbi:MAG: transglutaminase family protein [Ignavibacteriales bacterium]|nr:transglutaminase family protein [Ignavibacteriales bacterium]